MLHGSDFELVENDAVFESRFICGCELLQLQGFDLGKLAGRAALESFSHIDMCKLAGNAFSSPCFSAAVVTALMVFAKHMPKPHELEILRRRTGRRVWRT